MRSCYIICLELFGPNWVRLNKNLSHWMNPTPGAMGGPLVDAAYLAYWIRAKFEKGDINMITASCFQRTEFKNATVRF